MSGTWIFRVASRPEVGGGHVSRCRALAKALARHEPVLLVLDPGGAAWIPRLIADGLAAIVEGGEGARPWAGCVLDGYDFTADDASAWRARAGYLVVINDHGNPPAAADLAIGPAADLRQDTVNGVPVLAGPRYALLDPAFAEVAPRAVPDRVQRVLVSFGRRDSRNATLIALAALEHLADQGFRPDVTVAIESDAPHLPALRRQVEGAPLQARLALDAPGLLGLLREADLMVGAGGQSLFERMAAGVPSVTVTVADHQRRPVERASRVGATVDAGDVATLTAAGLAGLIANLAEDATARQAMSAVARAEVDGRGAQRVAGELLAPRATDRRGRPKQGVIE